METLAQRIEALASSTPAAPAFLSGDSVMSWSAYRDRSNRLAALLSTLGLEPRSRVAVLLPDGPGVHAAFVGIEKAGLVTMGIGPRAGRSEILHLLAKSGASVLVSRSHYRDVDMRGLADEAGLRHHIAVESELEAGSALLLDGEHADAAEANYASWMPRCVDSDELFLLNSTSGTTGMPKCVTHHQARWNHFHELAVTAADLGSDDVFMSVIPAPFGFGLWTAHFTPTLLGVPCVVVPVFDPDAMIREIERHRVTVLAAVSTQFVMMLGAQGLDGADLASLRVLFTGGEAVPYERALEFEERTGAAVLQFYGSNETGALSNTTLRDSREKRLRTAGRLIECMDVRLFDERGNDTTPSGRGIPGCRGPLAGRGYYGDAEANTALYTAAPEDGSQPRMLTGDLCTVDEEGYLSVVGRTGDFIIRGGKNISAPAVEQQVASHPAVALAAAVAMPDPVFGERVCVYAQLQPAATLDLPLLLAHLRARDVSPENLPERLEVLDELPRSSGGKVAKAQLRERIRQTVRTEATTHPRGTSR